MRSHRDLAALPFTGSPEIMRDTAMALTRKINLCPPMASLARLLPSDAAFSAYAYVCPCGFDLAEEI